MACCKPPGQRPAILGISRRALLLASTCAFGQQDGRTSALQFHPSAGGSFTFDTGILKGTFRSEGRSIGLLPVTHVPTGASLATSMGLFGIYRVFANGQRYGTGMWHVPSEATLHGDGSVSVVWPASEARPFAMTANYRWAAPNALDIRLEVTASQDLSGFETFLASYFGAAFASTKVLVKGGRLMSAERGNGQWQMFPRDPAAARLIYDGRWRFPPNPVEWAQMPDFELPVAIRTDPGTGLTAVVMAQERDCFAIATPEEADSHHSTYLSLFGVNLAKGAIAQARARLAVLQIPNVGQLRALYHEWVSGAHR